MTTKSPFHFGGLPKDIRRMVYDYVPEYRSRLLIPFKDEIKKESVWIEDSRPPTGLLLVSHALHDEVKAHFDKIIPHVSIIYLYQGSRYSDIRLLQDVLEALDLGHQYDQIHRKAHPEAAMDAPLDNFTRILPINNLKKKLASYYTVPDWDPSGFQIAPYYSLTDWDPRRVDFQGYALYRACILKLRRKVYYEVHVISDTEGRDKSKKWFELRNQTSACWRQCGLRFSGIGELENLGLA